MLPLRASPCWRAWAWRGDAHSGVSALHRSRVAKDPSAPNLRQVHLLHAELFEELAAAGFSILPGELGENITTLGLNLLALPQSAERHVGEMAVVLVGGSVGAGNGIAVKLPNAPHLALAPVEYRR